MRSPFTYYPLVPAHPQPELERVHTHLATCAPKVPAPSGFSEFFSKGIGGSEGAVEDEGCGVVPPT